MKELIALGNAPCGFVGRIHSVGPDNNESAISSLELENRLIEMGFVEGADVTILYEGLFGKDPIAVKVGNATIAIRRREAMAILVT